MTQPDSRQVSQISDHSPAEADLDTNLTSAADVASAGRSCLIVLVMLGLIVILLLAWVVYTTAGGTAQP